MCGNDVVVIEGFLVGDKFIVFGYRNVVDGILVCVVKECFVMIANDVIFVFKFSKEVGEVEV